MGPGKKNKQILASRRGGAGAELDFNYPCQGTVHVQVRGLLRPLAQRHPTRREFRGVWLAGLKRPAQPCIPRLVSNQERPVQPGSVPARGSFVAGPISRAMTQSLTPSIPAKRGRWSLRVRDPRVRVLTLAGIVLVASFWLLARYPALIHKADVVGESVASMTFASEIWSVGPGAPLLVAILAGAVNWLYAMKIGMSFGVLFGALLHTTLRHFPLRVGSSLTLNSVKGAVVGMPMGICANCAVPTACGVTRGNGRLEVALGFLFSSPNFNPVVVMMSIAALPLGIVAAKYAVMVLMIVVGVPVLVRRFGDKPTNGETLLGTEAEEGALLPSGHGRESIWPVAKDLGRQFTGHVWMLTKPTIAIMLVASLLSATALALLPLDELLAEPSGVRFALVSIMATFMPVPIALDVLFAAQLQAAGTAPGYVMIFAMTLGTYSIVPAIYLWREVSRKLSVVLFIIFAVIGWALAMFFQAGVA